MSMIASKYPSAQRFHPLRPAWSHGSGALERLPGVCPAVWRPIKWPPSNHLILPGRSRSSQNETSNVRVQNTLQVLGISLTDTTPPEDLFNKSNLSIDKELDGFLNPHCLIFIFYNRWPRLVDSNDFRSGNTGQNNKSQAIQFVVRQVSKYFLLDGGVFF